MNYFDKHEIIEIEKTKPDGSMVHNLLNFSFVSIHMEFTVWGWFIIYIPKILSLKI